MTSSVLTGRHQHRHRGRTWPLSDDIFVVSSSSKVKQVGKKRCEKRMAGVERETEIESGVGSVMKKMKIEDIGDDLVPIST